jgi:hypothetical protein
VDDLGVQSSDEAVYMPVPDGHLPDNGFVRFSLWDARYPAEWQGGASLDKHHFQEIYPNGPYSEEYVKGATEEESLRHFQEKDPGVQHEMIPVSRMDWETLLAVGTLYVQSFADTEKMTLPERLRLQEVEEILAKFGPRY